MDKNLARKTEYEYVRAVLAAYRQTPGTTGQVRRSDRLLAAQLYERDIPLAAVENALVLGASRRLYRSTPDAPPLPPVRSLHYFLGLIQEVLDLNMKPLYYEYLRYKIETFEQSIETLRQSRQS